MGYCRYCGREIVFVRTANERWMPCELSSGSPHFCNNDNPDISRETGISPCPRCGKPTFVRSVKRIRHIYDYTTLREHACAAKDIAKYQKYLKKQKSLKKK